MLESFLGEEVFRDGIRKYIAAHKYRTRPQPIFGIRCPKLGQTGG